MSGWAGFGAQMRLAALRDKSDPPAAYRHQPQRGDGPQRLSISVACVRNSNMEEPTGGTHWSMGKRASVWFWRASAAGAEDLVAAGSACFCVDRSLGRRLLRRSSGSASCVGPKVARIAPTVGMHDARPLCSAGHAGSWRCLPGADAWCGWRTGLAPAGEGFDDGHMPTAAWAWWAVVRRFIEFGIGNRGRDAQQAAGKRQAVLAG